MKITSIIKYRLLQLNFDIKNSLRYGVHSPRFAERLFFQPKIDMPVMSGGARYGVITSNWPLQYNSVVSDISPIKEVVSHFKQGYSWAETGLYDRMEKQLAKFGYVDG